jgi:hypothetical protein
MIEERHTKSMSSLLFNLLDKMRYEKCVQENGIARKITKLETSTINNKPRFLECSTAAQSTEPSFCVLGVAMNMGRNVDYEREGRPWIDLGGAEDSCSRDILLQFVKFIDGLTPLHTADRSRDSSSFIG